MVVGEISGELGIAGSSLSHHLEKLKNEGLVSVKRESTFLRYSANIRHAARTCSAFLYAECCTRNQAIEPDAIVQIAKVEKRRFSTTDGCRRCVRIRVTAD